MVLECLPRGAGEHHSFQSFGKILEESYSMQVIWNTILPKSSNMLHHATYSGGRGRVE